VRVATALTALWVGAAGCTPTTMLFRRDRGSATVARSGALFPSGQPGGWTERYDLLEPEPGRYLDDGNHDPYFGHNVDPLDPVH
jgi:hypothetical protein